MVQTLKTHGKILKVRIYT